MSVKLKKMADVNVGDFVRFNDKDKSGKFHYIGQVIEINQTEMGFFTMETFQGTMSFTLDSENDLESAEKPVGWDKFIKDPFKYRGNAKQKEVLKDIAPVVKTQKEMIFDCVKDNKKLTKVKLLKVLKKQFPTMSDVKLANNMELALIKLN